MALTALEDVSRRVFLKRSAFVLAASVVCRRAWGSSTRAANETLGVGVIGVAGQGLWNIEKREPRKRQNAKAEGSYCACLVDLDATCSEVGAMPAC